jgi:hypothetical protein
MDGANENDVKSFLTKSNCEIRPFFSTTVSSAPSLDSLSAPSLTTSTNQTTKPNRWDSGVTASCPVVSSYHVSLIKGNIEIFESLNTCVNYACGQYI